LVPKYILFVDLESARSHGEGGLTKVQVVEVWRENGVSATF
jgi:hypothetical protein